MEASGRNKWLQSTKLAPGVTEETVKAALTNVFVRPTSSMVTSIRIAYPVRVNILVPTSEAEEIKSKPPFRLGLLKGAFARSRVWNSDRTDWRGDFVLEWAAVDGLAVLNQGDTNV